jgi:single-strand DNA-binding protein
MSINKVILLGRVGKNPDIKDINGVKCATFSLATGEKYKDRNGNLQEKTQWHNIVAWRATADICDRYVKQGDQLCVEGKIEYRSWETDRGEKRYATDIVAERVELLGKGGASSSPADDDLPA